MFEYKFSIVFTLLLYISFKSIIPSMLLIVSLHASANPSLSPSVVPKKLVTSSNIVTFFL